MALGVRPGELLGLRWADWDRAKGNIYIERAVKKEGGRTHVGPLKTRTSRRELPVPDHLVPVLEADERHQQAERLSARAWREGDWIFATQTGGMINPDNFLITP